MRALNFCFLLSAFAVSGQPSPDNAVAVFGHRIVAAGGGGGSAPGFDVRSTNVSATSVGSLSWPITNNGVNRLQFVTVGTGDTAQPPVSNVWNSAGQSFTKAWATNATTWVRNEGWYLINPPSGSNLITVMWTTAVGSPDQTLVAALNFTNVHQTTPIGTPLANAGNSGAPAITVTSGTSELVVGAASTDAQGTLAISGSGTVRALILNVGSDTDHGAGTWAGASSVATAWTSGVEKWAVGAVSLKGP